MPAVQDATGYQWRTTASTPGDFVDGAENGLGNFAANISPDYTAISTAEHATGASSFHLRGFGGAAAPTQQTLTVNESVLANANSSLGFDSAYWNILNETASVDVVTRQRGDLAVGVQPTARRRASRTRRSLTRPCH